MNKLNSVVKEPKDEIVIKHCKRVLLESCDEVVLPQVASLEQVLKKIQTCTTMSVAKDSKQELQRALVKIREAASGALQVVTGVVPKKADHGLNFRECFRACIEKRTRRNSQPAVNTCESFSERLASARARAKRKEASLSKAEINKRRNAHVLHRVASRYSKTDLAAQVLELKKQEAGELNSDAMSQIQYLIDQGGSDWVEEYFLKPKVDTSSFMDE